MRDENLSKLDIGAPIIDTHTHAGSVPQFFAPDTDLDSIVDVMDQVGIDLCLCSGLECLLTSLNWGHQIMVQRLKKAKDRILGYVVFNPNFLFESVKCLEYCVESDYLVGVKIHPSAHCYPADGNKYDVLWRFAAENNIPILTHTSDYDWKNPVENYSHPRLFEKWAKTYTEVKIVLGHAGRTYNGHLAAAHVVARNRNVYLELSGDSYLPGLYEYLVGMVGDDHVLFGSDLPWIDPRSHIGAILHSKISLQAKKNILGGNAVRVFGLEEHLHKLCFG